MRAKCDSLDQDLAFKKKDTAKCFCLLCYFQWYFKRKRYNGQTYQGPSILDILLLKSLQPLKILSFFILSCLLMM